MHFLLSFSNFFLVASETWTKHLQPKIRKWETEGFLPKSLVVEACWSMPLYSISKCISLYSLLGPKCCWQILSFHHWSSHLHNSTISSFHNYILLRSIAGNQMALYAMVAAIIVELCQTEFPSSISLKPHHSKTCLIFYKFMPQLKISKKFSFVSKEVHSHLSIIIVD